MDAWLGVEVRHLAALAAISETRSFRLAAEELGYVQSAVSQQIARLEELVGVRLIERSRGHSRVELTPAGEALLDHASSILARLHAAQADLRGLGNGNGPVLRVGVMQCGPLESCVPPALALAKSRAAGLRIEVREALSDADHFSAVEGGELDAAFAEWPLEEGPFEVQKLVVDPLCLVVPTGTARAWPTDCPPLAAIASEHLIAVSTWRMLELIESQMLAAGGHPVWDFTVGSFAAAQALVGAGLGMAILPSLAVDNLDPTTEAIDLAGVLPPRTLVVYWHRDRRRSESLSAFVEGVAEACGEPIEADPDPNQALAPAMPVGSDVAIVA